tara:strand:+ start:75 stop:1406 length:1332 start_codon:yes stop_codon:yes gene_type:complete
MNSLKIFSRSQFSILWWSGSLSSFGDWATLFASVALASQIGTTEGNSEITAVVPLVARIIPAFLSSLAGLIADKFNKKNIMIFCDLIRMVVVFLLFFADNLIFLFVINFISEIFSLIRQPSREAVVPEVVEKRNLVKANSLFAIGTYATLPIASIMLGVVSDFKFSDSILNYGNGWSGSVIFIFDSLTFLLSSYILVFLKSEKRNNSSRSEVFSYSEFKEGLSYFFKTPSIRNIAISISLSLFAAGALFILGYTFLTVDLGFSESSFGFMIAAFGLGILFSMAIVNYFVSSFSRVSFIIGVSMLLTGAGLFAAFRSTEFIYILFFIFLSGVGTGSIYLLTISFLQATTEVDLRGRVFGNFYSIGRVALLVSFLTTGLIANFLDNYFNGSGVEIVLQSSAIIIFVSGAISIVSGYKQINNAIEIENSNFNNLKLDFRSTEDEPE